MAAQTQSSACHWQPCPYVSDMATIKTKLEAMDGKLDKVVDNLHETDERVRSVELSLAKQNGVVKQRQWDAKSTMFVLMFVATLIGSLASFWRG